MAGDDAPALKVSQFLPILIILTVNQFDIKALDIDRTPPSPTSRFRTISATP